MWVDILLPHILQLKQLSELAGFTPLLSQLYALFSLNLQDRKTAPAKLQSHIWNPCGFSGNWYFGDFLVTFLDSRSAELLLFLCEFCLEKMCFVFNQGHGLDFCLFGFVSNLRLVYN